jgi:hypothetical protein
MTMLRVRTLSVPGASLWAFGMRTERRASEVGVCEPRRAQVELGLL